MVPYDHYAILPIFDGTHCPAFSDLVSAVQKAADAIGYPVFIRTDLAAAKHSGPLAYLASSAQDVSDVLAATIEDNELKFWTARFGPTSILVREWLNLEYSFTAFRGLPISREWRFFATADRIICAHPYWPADALEDHVDEAAWPNWRAELAEHNVLNMAQAFNLGEMAKKAAAAAGGGAWSVDFCRDHLGKWWLLDMATMKDSFHWKGCPNGY